ncbi:hypothetical protein [Flavobacterium humi]|uniref:Uncharacterized protein n=1 Tax=Flavobacterium humi TaxID=2562683 RepID=A0A4Z0L3A8_9FLAO|nr:hypothetical protein [Flavobacterium humi]TGD56710.1 hypothetical protein E4635_14810 [Flavobacterium humi]
MKKTLLLAFVLLGVLSCKKKEEPLPTQPGQEKTSTALSIGCFAFEGDYGTILLRVTDTLNGIKGFLKYDLYEKDSNTGTFKGFLKGDTLIADYTFQSEGTESTRQVAFLAGENQLLEGYGEMTPDGTRFKETKTLQFSKAMPLTKTDCKGTPDCPVGFGFVYSALEKKCLPVKTIATVLHPLKDGMASAGPQAYVLFSKDTETAELFLPDQDKSVFLSKTSEGNWAFEEYKLMAWKGYVLQYKGKPVYGGQ